MTKDYLHRVTAVSMTASDLNCKYYKPRKRGQMKREIRREGRRTAKQDFKKILESLLTNS